MDVRVREIAAAHDGLVAWDSMLAAGLSERRAARAVADLRRMHDGVWLTGEGRVTKHQRHLAATLTTADSVLTHASAGDLFGFRPRSGAFEVISRPGNGGPASFDGLLVLRSKTLEGHVVVRDGIRVTSPARTLLDLAPHLGDRRLGKAVREAIRLREVTALDLRLVLSGHRGRRGTRRLRDLAVRLDRLPLERTRSDAEARALEVLGAAGRVIPEVNQWLAGEEADLVWRASRTILEIDGPQFHQDPDEDARKEAAWRGAGWTVERMPSDVPFNAPEVLVERATAIERRGTDV